MSVKVEASHGGIPHGKIAAAGIIIALVSLYIAVIGHEVLGFDYFAFFGGIAAIGALIWGNSAIKRLCSYGIGAIALAEQVFRPQVCLHSVPVSLECSLVSQSVQ